MWMKKSFREMNLLRLFLKNTNYYYWYLAKLVCGESFEWFLKELELYLQTNQNEYNCFLFACQWTCQIPNFLYRHKRKIAKTYQWQNSCMCELPKGGIYMICRHISTYHFNEGKWNENDNKSYKDIIRELNMYQ